MGAHEDFHNKTMLEVLAVAREQARIMTLMQSFLGFHALKLFMFLKC
jgi:hypothetical protein